jgi:hypothetical protein
VAIINADIINTGFLHSGQHSPNRLLNRDGIMQANDNPITIKETAATFRISQTGAGSSLRLGSSHAIKASGAKRITSAATPQTAPTLRCLSRLLMNS